MKKTCIICGKKRIGLVCAKIGCDAFLCKNCAEKDAASVSVSDDSGKVLTMGFPMCAPCKEAFEGGINPAIFDNSNPTGNDAKLKSYLLHTVKHRDLYAGLATLFNLKPYTYH